MATKKIEALIKSITRKLGNIHNQKRTTYENILNSFLLERMAIRLLKNPNLLKRLVFKGGFVGLRVFESTRYTIDLDVLMQDSDIDKIAELAQDAIQKNLNDGVWFSYEKQASLETLGEYGGLRLYFRTGIGQPLKNIKKARLLHLGLGLGDIVVPSPVKTRTNSIIGDDSLTWQVYTIESSCAEKLHALIVRPDNSRSKDVFDLYYFLPKCRKDFLEKAINESFKARGILVSDFGVRPKKA